MKKIINWHKALTNKFMNTLGIDSYQLAWFSWFKGFITGVILTIIFCLNNFYNLSKPLDFFRYTFYFYIFCDIRVVDS